MDQDTTSPLSIETRDRVTVIHLHKSVSQSQNLAGVEAMLLDAVDPLEHPKVVIDFNAVDFFPSTGVGVIVAVRNKVAEKHGVVALAEMPELIEHMFTMTGLTKVMPRYDHLDEAVDALQVG